ncbi:MAG TPA: YncE family protein [Terriglobia bacterium]|nr:YncE family protein [Terriglobia bacterium]
MNDERLRVGSAMWRLGAGLILAAGLVVTSGYAPAAPNGGARPAGAQGAGTAAGYHVVVTYVIGGEGGWDYLTVDSEARRVYISRGTHVMVMDPDTGKVLGDIPGTDGVHGIALAPELNRGFISDGRSSEVTIFDLKTLKTLDTVKVTGQNPDCIAYDPASKRVFTFNGRSGNSTAIDAATGKVVGTIDLGGRPEFAVADGRGHIYNNLEDKSEQVAIDTQTLKVTHRWPLAPCESPSGLAIDREHRRLFAGCDNQKMAITDPDAGKVVTTVPIGEGVDANGFDPGSQLAFSSNGESGTLTVVHEDAPDQYTVLGNVPTALRARTMALDLKTHHVFVVTARFLPQPAEATPENPRRRPPMVPGSFRVIEVAP